jgi:hypothetical protein
LLEKGAARHDSARAVIIGYPASAAGTTRLAACDRLLGPLERLWLARRRAAALQRLPSELRHVGVLEAAGLDVGRLVQGLGGMVVQGTGGYPDVSDQEGIMTRRTTSKRRGPAIVVAALALTILAGVGGWYGTRPSSAAGGVSVDRYGDQLQTVPAGQLPVFAMRGGPRVAEPYRFASSEEGKALESVACYCGCGAIGHTSNRACYLTGTAAGTTTFTSHGAT